MAEPKTKETNESVTKFLNSVEDETKRKDSFAILEMMEQATGLPAKMWGPAIIGFGSYHYKYESGHEGDACITGFSPRKAAITLYVINAADKMQELLKQLGKYKTGGGCLYIKKLTDVDTNVLKKIIKASYDYAKDKNACV